MSGRNNRQKQITIKDGREEGETVRLELRRVKEKGLLWERDK